MQIAALAAFCALTFFSVACGGETAEITGPVSGSVGDPLSGTGPGGGPIPWRRAKLPLAPPLLDDLWSEFQKTIDLVREVDSRNDPDRAKLIRAVAKLRRLAGRKSTRVLSGRVDKNDIGLLNVAIDSLVIGAKHVTPTDKTYPAVLLTRTANEASSQMPKFYGRFDSRVPSTLYYMHFAVRETELAGEAGDPVRFSNALSLITGIWPIQRRRLIYVGGFGAALELGKYVAAIQRYKGRTDLTGLEAIGARGVRLMNEAERDFRENQAD